MAASFGGVFVLLLLAAMGAIGMSRKGLNPASAEALESRVQGNFT